MDCEACTDRMVDLLYGELDDSDVDATRAHLDACEACAGAFERLESGFEVASLMALEEPPAGGLASVLGAAKAKAADRTPSRRGSDVGRAAAPREDVEEAAGLWASILQWLGGLAMRPQLAMAMTLVLMIGIGLWYLPELRRDDPSDAQAIVDPTPGDEAGPSAGLVPAERLDLQADPRTGRIRAREAGEEPTPRPTRAHEPVAQRPSSGTSEAARAGSAAHREEPGGDVVAAPMDLPDGMEELALGSGETLSAGQAVEAEPVEPAPPPPAAAAHAASAATARTLSPAPAASPSPGGAAPDATDRYARGMQRYRERDYQGAAVDFDSVVRRPSANGAQLVPSALHQLARSHRAAGDCRNALMSYERLLTQYPRYGSAPQAMVEGADCYRRTGQLSRARAMLERAQAHPAVAGEAQRELTRLAAAERAHERAGAEPTPAAAAADRDVSAAEAAPE